MTMDGFVQSTEGAAGPLGIFLDHTSFYAESGGQVCDTGVIRCAGGALAVDDTKVGRCRLLVSKPVLKATMVSALETML